jgi:hypothetical protein
MTVHLLKGPRGLLGLLFGAGWVETLCGIEIPAGNGPDHGVSVDCPECQRLDQKRPLF